MAKETKLDKLLSQKTFDLKELEKLCTYGTNYDKYWKKYEQPVFKKYVVENYLHILTSVDIFKELRLKKYKPSIEKFFSQNQNFYYSDKNSSMELAELHQVKMPISVYNNVLNGNGSLSRIYNINFDKDAYKTFLFENMHSINEYNFDLIKDELNTQQIFKIADYCGCFNIKEYIKIVSEKTTFKEYLSRHTSQNVLVLDTRIMLIYGLDKCLEELLKSEVKIQINYNSSVTKSFITFIGIDKPFENKNDLTEEQTKYLLKYCHHSQLVNVFNLYPVEELFAVELSKSEDPSIYSDKVNDIILKGEWDKLKDGYSTFTSFSKINLTAETAKILLDNDKIKFKTYRKFAPKEEIDLIIKDKENKILSIYTKIQNYKENYKERTCEKSERTEDDFNPWTNRSLEYDMFGIIEDYDISLDFILDTFGKDVDSYSKGTIALLLMRGDVFGRPRCFWN